MARILSQAAVRDSVALSRCRSLPSYLLSTQPRPHPILPSSRFLGLRWRSGRSEKHSQIFEVVIEPATDAGGGEAEGPAAETGVEVAVRRLEDVIHGILARRAAPDWLPFIPGSSYWVPPRSNSYRLVEVLGRAANPMTDEEVMSLTTAQGWPCAAHLLEDLSADSVKTPNETSTESDGEDS